MGESASGAEYQGTAITNDTYELARDGLRCAPREYTRCGPDGRVVVHGLERLTPEAAFEEATEVVDSLATIVNEACDRSQT